MKSTHTAHSFMLFRKTDSWDPISYFKDTDELLRAEIFSSENELNEFKSTHAVLGAPFVLKVDIDKPALEKLIADDEVKKIAEHVKTINDRPVTFDHEEFSYIGMSGMRTS